MGTLEFYDMNAEAYAEKTFEADVSDIRSAFTELLPENARILDLGCGSGRDSSAFSEMGFDVVPVDGSKEMCSAAERLTNMDVRNILFEDLDYTDEFDGVWACSSLLHIGSDQLGGILQLIRRALKEDGLLFSCFKKGNFEGYRSDGRFYLDLEPDALNTVLLSAGFMPVRIWTENGDASDTVWVNSLARKSSGKSVRQGSDGSDSESYTRPGKTSIKCANPDFSYPFSLKSSEVYHNGLTTDRQNHFSD